MAQLDEARTISDTVAAHVADHNQLHAKANYVFDVTDFGATGDGATDDTAAIQAAIDACETAGGGTVLMPTGDYRITAQLTVPTLTNIVGMGTGLHSGSGGTRILPETTSQAVFKIGALVRFVSIKDMSIVAASDSIGIVGVLLEAAAADGQSDHLVISGVHFYRIDKGIYANSTTGEWSFTNVRIDNCKWDEIDTACIHMNSQNFDSWRISNCALGTFVDGLYLEASGFLTVFAMFGSAASAPGVSAFVRIEQKAGPLTMIQCQAETIDHHVIISGGSSFAAPLTLISNVVNAPITVDENWVVNLIGNLFTAAVTGSATDAQVLALGNSGATYSLGGNNRNTIFDLYDIGISLDVPVIGFYGATPAVKPTVTGARDDGTALADLLTELATLGLLTDSSTAT